PPRPRPGGAGGLIRSAHGRAYLLRYEITTERIDRCFQVVRLAKHSEVLFGSLAAARDGDDVIKFEVGLASALHAFVIITLENFISKGGGYVVALRQGLQGLRPRVTFRPRSRP